MNNLRNRKKRHIQWIVIIMLVIFIATVVVIGVFGNTQKKYEQQISLADRYLNELDYEKAVAGYRAAIAIDPKNPETYKILAETYIVMEDPEAAEQILLEGLAVTKDDLLRQMLTDMEQVEMHTIATESESVVTSVNDGIEIHESDKDGWHGGNWTKRDDILPYINNEGYMVFGAYEQDGDESNGPEPLEWEVLGNDEYGTILVSRYVLDAQPYNIDETAVTWETCTLRRWLNEDFLYDAFTFGEQECINNSDLSNPDSSMYGTEGGNDTRDKVFCLSVDEVRSYYNFNKIGEQSYSTQLIIVPTEYAKQKGVDEITLTQELYDDWHTFFNYDSNVIGCVGAWWWLRSPGHDSDCASVVSNYGACPCWHVVDNLDDECVGVRPALHLIN